jgi:hypothetical protein
LSKDPHQIFTNNIQKSINLEALSHISLHHKDKMRLIKECNKTQNAASVTEIPCPPPSPKTKASQGNMLVLETPMKKWEAGVSSGPTACSKIKGIHATIFSS